MPDVFERIVCGIDGSPESFEALRQVERLRPGTGELHLTTVAELSLVVHGGFAATRIYDRLVSDAESDSPVRATSPTPRARDSSRESRRRPCSSRSSASARQPWRSAVMAIAGQQASSSAGRRRRCSTTRRAPSCSLESLLLSTVSDFDRCRRRRLLQVPARTHGRAGAR